MALIVNVHNYAGTRDTLSASIDRSPARYGLDLVSAGARCNVPAIVERIEAGDIVSKPGEQVAAIGAQQGVEHRLVDFGRRWFLPGGLRPRGRDGRRIFGGLKTEFGCEI